MNPEVILGAMALVPIVILMVFRINAALVFLSLCLGNVLVEFVANDAAKFLTAQHSALTSIARTNDNTTMQIILLLLPVVLTSVFMIRTVHGTARLLLNLLPAAGVGLLGALLVVPLLPGEFSAKLTETTLWSQTASAQNVIVGASALACLFVLWLQRPSTGGKKHGKHKS